MYQKYEHEYFVYIMASISKVLYIGVTNDIYERTLQHKNDINEGFTKKYRCHKLVYYETFQYIDNAIAREKQLKNWHRQWKMNLIKEDNPNWKDLFNDFLE